MTSPYLCPVHGYARKHCSWRCLHTRQEFRKLCADYRQLWYDRRRGVRPVTLDAYRIRYGWPEPARQHPEATVDDHL